MNLVLLSCLVFHLVLAESRCRQPRTESDGRMRLSTTPSTYDNKDKVLETIKLISSKTCITFVNNKKNGKYVKVVGDGSDCRCDGYGPSKETFYKMNLGAMCIDSIGTIAHELAHVLGFHHYYIRDDRDDYITINHENIETDWYRNNFEKVPGGAVAYTEYDYGNFMHYGPRTRTINKTIDGITTKDPNYQFTIGSRRISLFDWHMINLRYGCYEAMKCLNGGVQNPNNCSQCLCPTGYGSTDCSKKHLNGCGVMVTVSEPWRTFEWPCRNGSNLEASWTYKECSFHFMIRLEKIRGWYATVDSGSCSTNGIELKIGEDPTMSGPVSFNTTLNPIPVIIFNRKGRQAYSISTRFIRQ